MKTNFFRHKHEENRHGGNRRLSLPGAILMTIGFLTVLYLFIVYILIPVLAMLTVS